MNNQAPGKTQEMSIQAQKTPIQSFGLEFGPNFFTAHFFADHAGEAYIGSSTSKADDWTSIEKQIGKIAMPLFGIIHSPVWTIVPVSVFDEDHAEDFLNFNVSPRAGHTLSHDHILPLDAVLIYRTNPEAEAFADAHFPGLGLRNGAGVLLQIIGRMQRRKPQTATYIYQLGQYYHVSVFQNGKLLLTNAVEAAHLEDIQYFILFILNQLQIAPSHSIFLLGDAVANDALKKSLGKFYPSIANLMYDESLQRSTDSSRHFMGLNAHLCV